MIENRFTIRHCDFPTGTIQIHGDGPIRRLFGEGMEMPDGIYKATEGLLRALYEESGEWPTIHLFGGG